MHAIIPPIGLLGWYQTSAKYKTGKKMAWRSLADLHLDANDKIDRMSQFLDRSP